MKNERCRRMLAAAIGVVCMIGMLLLTACVPKVSTTAGDIAGNGTAGTTANSAAGTETVNISGDVTYYADILIKDYGTITVKLDGNAAPVTVANFVQLAESGFYDGLTFHRIINGFMMQGGDPLGNGYGGSENNIYGEFASNGFTNDLSHTRGAVSMARSKDPNSASSQFFIVHKDSTYLDGDYAVFGYVTEGMDIVDAICASAKPIDGNGLIASDEQPVIESVTIRTE